MLKAFPLAILLMAATPVRADEPMSKPPCCWCCGIGNVAWCIRDPWTRQQDAECEAARAAKCKRRKRR
jgi:hypothetical protein